MESYGFHLYSKLIHELIRFIDLGISKERVTRNILYTIFVMQIWCERRMTREIRENSIKCLILSKNICEFCWNFFHYIWNKQIFCLVVSFFFFRFLWNVYCNDSGTHIVKQDFAKALQIEETYQQSGPSGATKLTSAELHTKSQNVLLSLFGHSDRVNFEQFKQWITRYERATVLSRWLLLESCVNLSTELETPTFYQSLAGVTHLEEQVSRSFSLTHSTICLTICWTFQDIGDLEKTFWSLKGLAKSGQLDLESLAPLISPPVPLSALNGVFSAFDENRDGHIDFKELCCGVSAACRGPTVERSKCMYFP